MKTFQDKQPTSWSPLPCFFPDSYTFTLLQFPTEVTGTHLLWGILCRLPKVRNIRITNTVMYTLIMSIVYEWMEEDHSGPRVLRQPTMNFPYCTKLSSFTIQNVYLYLILVWPGRSRLEYCLDKALKSPSPLPLPPLAGSNVGLAAVVILMDLQHQASMKKCSLYIPRN